MNYCRMNYWSRSRQGRPSPSGHNAFSPCFRFPSLFSKNFQTLWKIFKILPFPEKFLDFHPPKFLMTFFLVIDHKFRIFPSIFPLSIHFPSVSRKLLFPPTLTNPPCFRKIHRFFTYFMCISFPPIFTMMHLCITQCTYWTQLEAG